MYEWNEIAERMLDSYMRYLEEDSINGCRTMNNAREFIKCDPFLKEESAQMQDNIAQALHRLSGRINQ